MNVDKILLGYLSVLLMFPSNIPYFVNIFKGKTKPHAFSWLVWSLLNGIAFAAQVVKGGGAGSWVTGINSGICFAVFVLALVKGERKFVLFDWISLSGAFLALLFWVFTKDPTVSVVLVTVTDLFGFLPTFRKGYEKPYEETVVTFAVGSLYFFVSMFALESFTFVTWLYPLSIVVTNWIFVTMILVRRKQIKKSPLFGWYF